MSMKNSNDTIGNRTRDLPPCSAVPRPTSPPPPLNSVPYLMVVCSNVPHKPTHVVSFAFYVPRRRTLMRTLTGILMVIWCDGSSIKQLAPQLALSLRQHYTQSQMSEQFKCLAYLGGTVTPSSVLARRPTLPGASVSVKEGVVKKSTLVWRCTVTQATLRHISVCSKLSHQ